jgi:hypothetical protein
MPAMNEPMLSTEARSTWNSLTIWLAFIVLPYAALSLAMYCVRYSETIRSTLAYCVSFVWLAGPAALLLINLRDSWVVYSAGTGIVLTSGLVAIHYLRKWSDVGIFGVLLAVVVWIVCGLMPYLALV